ncbi:MFS transporter [Aetokthonos hydrillicola Thurmond2011]|jgi:PAT family beta-lactamase induction signal transducer AmpG|uniref:MFS transporter n=1 Tax=Aetokthonos hydrillicola Thurmond2011 TaxID=2712845 RepID=A0AAP5M8Z0_9CYAN|nr:MFS transporter [Aetokthonos hydrillicola]MBO3458089.1 MFS transporter [Aetokthonos hydrillicola CCALA 1050]MBW4587075.1 MFS transporter [Aetokthonos hydrillicola CCALA 1050]MDR9899676.1 MFS transporter [Aetokthonos hydrillicola Thurmond2011]
MAALLFIGFSSGLPFYLTSKTPLQAWLTKENVSLDAIAAFSLVGLPYSLKFVWAPILDRFIPPFLGRRRGWLVITQVGLLIAIAAMAFQKPSEGLKLLAIAATIVAFLSASQDIVADAYRTDVLAIPERGPGASVFLLGYRLAILVTGYVTLFLADRMPWQGVYLLMSLLMLFGVVSSILAPEPVLDLGTPQTLYEAVTLPFIEFFRRNGSLQAVLILVFIVIYKLGDSLLKNVSTPFLLAKGLNFTQSDIALPGGLGIVAVIVGTLVAGAVISKIGINRSLWIFAILQAVGNLAYFALAVVGKNYPLMVLAINIENFCAGLESAAFVAFLMSLCNQGYSATQFALLSSLQGFSRDILVAPAGVWAQATGWPLFFLLTAIAALPGLLLLPFFAPWNPQPVTIPRPGLDDEEDLWGRK